MWSLPVFSAFSLLEWEKTHSRTGRESENSPRLALNQTDVSLNMWFDAHHASCSSLLQTESTIRHCAPLLLPLPLINYTNCFTVRGNSFAAIVKSACTEKTNAAICATSDHASLSSIPNEREFHFLDRTNILSLFSWFTLESSRWTIGQMDPEGCGWSKATTSTTLIQASRIRRG